MSKPKQATGYVRISEVENGIMVLVEHPGENPEDAFKRARGIMSPVWSVWELDQQRIEKARTRVKWAVGIAVLWVAFSFVLALMYQQVHDRARAAEQWRLEQLARIGKYVVLDDKGNLLPDQILAGINAKLSANAYNLHKAAIDIDKLRQDLARCDCEETMLEELDKEFAGPDPTLSDGLPGEVDQRQEEKGPIRLGEQ